jgi:DNA-binding GntR family transcriptional regulator
MPECLDFQRKQWFGKNILAIEFYLRNIAKYKEMYNPEFFPAPIARHQSLYQQTYQALYIAILSGEITPGERLVETQLADRFQVSRTPIREAMRQLQLRGLVTSDAKGNWCVASISVADAMQLYDCRIALEQMAAKQACIHITPAQMDQIEQTLIASDMVAGQLEDPSGSLRLLSLNFQFHRLIAEASGNVWIVPLLEQLADKITLLRVQTLRDPKSVSTIHSEHWQIYEAILRKEPEAAARAITQHLQISQQRIQHYLE